MAQCTTGRTAALYPGLLAVLWLHTGLQAFAGLWPPSRSEDHPKMDQIPKGFQTKVSHTSAWGSQAMGRKTREGTRDKHTLLCALCICWQAGPSWNSSLSKLCQRQLEWAACLTSPCRKQGRKETRLNFDPERGTTWHSGVASFFSSFLFFFLKKTTDVWSLGPQDTF